MNEKNLRYAASVLRSGGVVAYPTDTAYALGCLFDSRRAKERIMKIKKRRDKKFTIIASSLYQAEKFFSLSAAAKRLTRKYWPGPLSLAVSSRYAVRVPAHKTARLLARYAKKPILATSANRSGEKDCYAVRAVIASLKKSGLLPDLILDAGILPKKDPSTIVGFKGGRAEVLREGPIRAVTERS